jgi:transposase-like protein
MRYSKRFKDEVFEAYARGATSGSLAAQHGVHPAWVRNLFLRMGGEPSERTNAKVTRKNAFTTRVSDKARDKLAEHARARGISVGQLLARLAETAAESDLINAVLDDGAEA